MDYAGVPAGLSLADIPIRRSSDLGAFDHLAVGEHTAIVVRYNVKDAQGATVAQSATITVTGTNDAPMVNAALMSGAAEGTNSFAMNLLSGASDVDHYETATLRVAG